MVDYIYDDQQIDHSLLNDLYSEFDNKLSTMLSSGKSFVFAIGDGNRGMGNWTEYPLYKLLGQKFAFFSGTTRYIQNIGANSRSYDHTPFTSGEGAVIINSLDATGNLAYINNVYDTVGVTCYTDIGRTSNSFVGFFDYSLEAHNISGYYLYEDFQSPDVGRGCPEKKYNYALADIFAENVYSIDWNSSWDKYKCLRFHNLNCTSNLTVNFTGTSQTFTLSPLGCSSYRNYSGVWDKSPFTYFQEYKTDDPISYWFWPRQFSENHGKPLGKSIYADVQTPQNSQVANNLTNTSIIFDFIETMSHKYGSLNDYERTYSSYYKTKNCYFNLYKNKNGLDVTNLYCIDQQPTGASILTTTGVPSSLSFYDNSASLPLQSGLSSLDIYSYFSGKVQPVTCDLFFNNYGPETIKFYAQRTDSQWALLDTKTGISDWSGRKSFYISHNGRAKNFRIACEFDNNTGDSVFTQYNFNGFFGNPKSDSTIIGDLFFHRGELLKAKVSKTKFNIDSVTPLVEFEKILFNGFENIVADFANYDILVDENSEGQLQFSNLDSGNYVDLIPISTNLFKFNSYDYSAVSGFNPIHLDNSGVAIDNHIFESNLVSRPGQVYTAMGNHANTLLHEDASKYPPVLVSNIYLYSGYVTGSYQLIYFGNGSYPEWITGASYSANSRVSRCGNHFYSLVDTTGVPSFSNPDWTSSAAYAEAYDPGRDYLYADYIVVSGAFFRYIDSSTPLDFTTVHQPRTYNSTIELLGDHAYDYDYVQSGWENFNFSYLNHTVDQYTGLIRLHSDTVSLLKNFEIYGLDVTGYFEDIGMTGYSLTSIINKSLYYEPEGLTLSYTESAPKFNGATFDLTQSNTNYFTSLGYFEESGSSIARDRKCQFRGNGFGYVGTYLGSNELGSNATSYFLPPRFGRPYSDYGMVSGTNDFFDLVERDIYGPSGEDFYIKTGVAISYLSEIQQLVRINPHIYKVASEFYNCIKFQDSFSNFAYYKNDSAVENCYFDYDAATGLGFYSGYLYAGLMRDSPEPPAYNDRRFYVPLYSEHYNLMAEYSNSIRSASVLDLPDFIYWTYSGETFTIKSMYGDQVGGYGAGDGLVSPEVQDFSPSVTIDSNIPRSSDIPFLPKDSFIAFKLSGVNHAGYFRQFFEGLGVPIYSRADWGAQYLSGISMSSAKTNSYKVIGVTDYYDVGTGDPHIYDAEFLSTYTTYTGLTYDPGIPGDTIARFNLLAKVTGLIVHIDSRTDTSDYFPDPAFTGYSNSYWTENYGWIKKSDWFSKMDSMGLAYDIVDCYAPLRIFNNSRALVDGRIQNGGGSFNFDVLVPSTVIFHPYSPDVYTQWGDYSETGNNFPYSDSDSYGTHQGIGYTFSGEAELVNWVSNYADLTLDQNGEYKTYLPATEFASPFIGKSAGDGTYVINDTIYKDVAPIKGVSFLPEYIIPLNGLASSVGSDYMLHELQLGYENYYTGNYWLQTKTFMINDSLQKSIEDSIGFAGFYRATYQLDYRNSSIAQNKTTTIKYTPDGYESFQRDVQNLTNLNYVVGYGNAFEQGNSSSFREPSAAGFNQAVTTGQVLRIEAPTTTGRWLFEIDSYNTVVF